VGETRYFGSVARTWEFGEHSPFFARPRNCSKV
jgi:hypothetical protein